MDFSGTAFDITKAWHVEPLDSWRSRAVYTSPEGTVDLACYALIPGIMLMDIDLACTRLPVAPFANATPATVNWCRRGRCEVDLGTRGSIVVGGETLCLSTAQATCFSYPTGEYRGFEYVVDLAALPAETESLLAAFDLGLERLRGVFDTGAALNARATGGLGACVTSIEDELGKERPARARLLLETVNLLVLLADGGLDEMPSSAIYLRRSQREMARAVYNRIAAGTAPSVSLAPLAAEFGVSESSLRAYFEKVYGSSPAAFARSQALGHAAQLLAEGDDQVGSIALACGYSNPGKFSAAFRRAYGMTPLEYRRRARVRFE